MGLTSFFSGSKTETGKEDSDATQPTLAEANTVQSVDEIPDPAGNVPVLHFAEAGRTTPLSFEEAREDLIELNRWQAFRLTKDLDTSDSAVSGTFVHLCVLPPRALLNLFRARLSRILSA